MTAEPPTVLVVDDEPPIREIVAMALGLHGYRVATAGDGPAALAWLATHRADVLVLDLQMAPLTGIAVLEALAERGGPLPPTVAFTAYLMAGHTEPVTQAVQRLAPGAEILTKPMDLDDLVAAVARAAGPGEAAR
jgi:CheY-like chemotaxis protein